MDKFEEAWKENRHVWESSKNLAKAMYLAGQQSRQAEVNFLKAQLGIKREQIKGFESEIKKAWQAVEEKDKRIEELEGQLKAVHALARMRSAVITADRWFTLKPHIQNAIKCLDKKEKALRGEHE
ncbi:hypothetical protein KW868_02585 [Acinetobacter guillouiae]|uniref:Uncharacterized protein n=1 Tax=Acinetobacter guillouiae TaxID=106649 RepID=A0A8X8GGM3_ACIGI|nr:hypothetical protein [Acinetobacter guillouiae]MCF0263362.1 hypothetical protein [Acinetobacter guillouiae]